MSAKELYSDDDAKHADILTLDQMEQISSSIAANQPMISEAMSPDCLAQEYALNHTSTGFVPGIQFLAKNYRFLRKVRGDGNCFYRAFLFGYLESLLVDYQLPERKDLAIREHERMTGKIQNCMKDIVDVGYSEFAVETFYDVRHVNLYCMD